MNRWIMTVTYGISSCWVDRLPNCDELAQPCRIKTAITPTQSHPQVVHQPLFTPRTLSALPIMDFLAFKQSITGSVAQFGDSDYQTSRWASNTALQAKYVVYPANAGDVSKAVVFAKASNLDLAICGGRHATCGASSSEGLVIDLSNMNNVRIDAENKLAYVQGGATSAVVDSAAIEHGLATCTAKCSTVGIGGMATAGGFSWLTGLHGLLIDNMVAATVVVANGDILTCSANENTDLFWAIRGAGSNFGPIVEFTFKLHDQPREIYSTTFTYPTALLPIVAQQINRWVRKQSPVEAGSLMIATDTSGSPSLIFQGLLLKGNFAAGEAAFKGFAELGPAEKKSAMIPFADANAVQNSSAPPSNRLHGGLFTSRTDLKVFKKTLESYTRLVDDAPTTCKSTITFEFVHTDKLCSVPAESAAYAQRSPAYNILINTRWQDASFANDAHAATYNLANTIASASYSNVETNIGYGAYADVEARTEGGAKKLFGGNYERLQKIKAAYDPDLLFNKWFAIQPSA